MWSFEQLHCCPNGASIWVQHFGFSLSDSSPRCRVALPGATRNQAWKLSNYQVFHLVGQKESMKIRNTTNSSLAPKWRGRFLVFKRCFSLFFKLGLIGVFKDLLFCVWYGHCVLADFNPFQWVAGCTGIACYVCISVALPGDTGPFALVCGHAGIKCNLTLAQFGEKLLQPCHTLFFSFFFFSKIVTSVLAKNPHPTTTKNPC